VTPRRTWLARLPEMRIAYFELGGAYERAPNGPLVPKWEAIGGLWDAFNDWRVQTRPALGRIDVAALGLTNEDTAVLRAGVPIRSDYRPPEPAKTALFPGGSFAYVYADNVDEIDEAAAAARTWIESQGLQRISGLIEAYKFHYNQDQHPCDCGFLVLNADGSEPIPPPLSHTSPLPIARD
jgi:hypothetical protein